MSMLAPAAFFAAAVKVSPYGEGQRVDAFATKDHLGFTVQLAHLSQGNSQYAYPDCRGRTNSRPAT